MTNGLRDARSKMSKCLRRKSCDPRTLFPSKVQVRETVREVKSKEPELRVAKARIKVLEADVAVEKAKSRAALAKVRQSRGVVRIKQVEVPGPERVVERVVEVPGPERVREVRVPVEKRVEVPVERKHTPEEVEAELREMPPAKRQRIIYRVQEDIDALLAPRKANQPRYVAGMEGTRPAETIRPEP